MKSTIGIIGGSGLENLSVLNTCIAHNPTFFQAIFLILTRKPESL